MHRKPPMALVTLAAVALVGFYASSLARLSPASSGYMALGTLLTGLAYVIRHRRPRLVPLCLGLATVAWGGLLGAALQPSAPPSLPRGGLARITARIDRSGCGQGSCWSQGVLLTCEGVESEACPDRQMTLGLHTAAELPLHGEVAALVRLRPRARFHNPGPDLRWPDQRPRLSARTAAGSAVKVREAPWLSRWILAARGVIREALLGSLAAPHAGVARALLLGEGAAVPGALDDAIRAAGVSHVLAVSGMHVTVLAGSLVALLRWLWLRSPWALRFEAARIAAGLGALLAPLVGLLCGSAPSAMRAAWTSALMFALRALGRRPSCLAVTAFVIVVQLARAPEDAVHPGFVLSVAATTALLTGRARPGRGWLQTLRDSTRAWLGTAPFLVLCFGGASLVATLANVVLLPVGSVLIPAVALHLICVLLGAAPWLPTGFAFQTASGAFVSLSSAAAALDPRVSLAPLTPIQALTLSLAALACLRLRAARGWAAALTVCLSGYLAAEWVVRQPLAPGELRITFLDVGQGDAALIETGAGGTALIDGGGRVTPHGVDPGEAAVLPFLASLRIRRLDLVVLSHPHPDHYGGLFAVLRHLEVAELWDTGQAEAEDPSGEAAALLSLARSRGVRVRGPRELCDAPQSLAGARLTVFAPCPGFDPGYDPNDNSLVLRLDHGKRRFLFAGDAEAHEEAALVRRHGRALAADVLKVGHHGSRTSSTPAWLDHVQPWLAVISAGRGNPFGHPHPQALSQLARRAAHVLDTAQRGGIRVVSDGETVIVDAWDRSVTLTSDATRLPVK